MSAAPLDLDALERDAQVVIAAKAAQKRHNEWPAPQPRREYDNESMRLGSQAGRALAALQSACTPETILALVAAARRGEADTPAKKAEPSHVCGMSGYNGMIDPPCPACEAMWAPRALPPEDAK